MKVSFYWKYFDDDVAPVCEASQANDSGVDFISCILTDDGGLGYLNSISWLNEGLKRIDEVRNGKHDSLDWEREDWGAKFTASQVTIYSLYEPTYSTSLPLDIFQKALLGWRDFLSEGPRKEKQVFLHMQ